MQAEVEPVQQSFLSFALQSLGIYSLLLPAVALLSVAMVLVIVIRGRGPMACAALVLLVPMPLLVGCYAALSGAIGAFSVIATSAMAPKPSEVAAGVSTALIAPLVGIWLMTPGFLIATVGTFARAVLAKADT